LRFCYLISMGPVRNPTLNRTPVGKWLIITHIIVNKNRRTETTGFQVQIEHPFVAGSRNIVLDYLGELPVILNHLVPIGFEQPSFRVFHSYNRNQTLNLRHEYLLSRVARPKRKHHPISKNRSTTK